MGKKVINQHIPAALPRNQARSHGGISGPCPPNHCLYLLKREMSQSKGCVPKKVTGSVPLECSCRPETPKILTINPVFVGKNLFFADFAMKPFFLVSSLEFEGKKFLCQPPPPPSEIVYAPSYAALALGLPGIYIFLKERDVDLCHIA